MKPHGTIKIIILTDDKNLNKPEAMTVISCKLIRVFYMILTTGKDYDGQKMLLDIRRPEAIKAA